MGNDGLSLSIAANGRCGWKIGIGGTPFGAAPPTPPGIRVSYHGGSIGLSRDRNVESGEAE